MELTGAHHSATGSGAEYTETSGVGGEGVHIQYFNACGCPLDMVTSFKYLGRVI